MRDSIPRAFSLSVLQTIRIVFRLLFTVPLLVLGIDGVRPHHPINESMAWTGWFRLSDILPLFSLLFKIVDTLTMISAVGCGISSGITLVVRSSLVLGVHSLMSCRFSSLVRLKVKSQHAMLREGRSVVDFSQENLH